MHNAPGAISSQYDRVDQGKNQSWELEEPSVLDKHLSQKGVAGIERE